MRVIHSVTAAVSPGSSRRIKKRFIRAALVVSGWLSAKLHLLVTPEDVALGMREIRNAEKNKTISGEVDLKSVTTGFAEAVLESIETQETGLFIMSIGREEPEPWQQYVLENSLVPVMAIPECTILEPIPFGSVVVPMSGEERLSSALSFALYLAGQAAIPVDLIHVTLGGEPCLCDPTMIGHLSDQFYYEYPGMVEEFIAQAAPYATPREKRLIREFWHLAGETVEEIMRLLEREPENGLLVMEWKGALAKGRARIVKRILQECHYPILLVKPAAKAESRLNVWKKFSAA